MGTITTSAWVLHEHPRNGEDLQEEDFTFTDISDDEVLVAPVFVSWEANINHAIERSPINIARRRREDPIVLGNAGVVRVLQRGSTVINLKEDDICLFYPCGRADQFGYLTLVHGYDAPGTMGLLAKIAKVPGRTLIPLPKETPYSLQQWAAFSARYVTAWSNFKVALGTFRIQIPETEMARPFVWGWGGGTTFAELDLARRFGCLTVMISGSQAHLAEIERAGIEHLDRRKFPDLNFKPALFDADRLYRKRYSHCEKLFLKEVNERTSSLGVSVFIDCIGEPVYRATLRALSRQGVITTAGWRAGMQLPINRAIECINRHTHVFTHGYRVSDIKEAIDYAHRTGWMPQVARCYAWSEIPQLCADFRSGRTDSYFPIVKINSDSRQ